MKKYTTIFLSAILIVSMFSVAGLAQPYGSGVGDGSGFGAGKGVRGPARGGMNAGQAAMRGFRNLDLTDDQRAQIQSIMEEHREVMLADCEATSAEMQSLKAELAALHDSGYYNEEAARQLLYRKFEINTEKQILRQKVHHQILWDVLTDEQRETLDNQRANAEAFGRGSRRGGGMRGAGTGTCVF